MRRYTSYQNTRYDWLPTVPAHWQSTSMRSITLPSSERCGAQNKTLLSVYREYGVIVKISRDDNHNKESEDLSNYKIVRKNDLVMNKMKMWQGSLGISSYDGIVSPAYIVCHITIDNINHRYLHLLLRSSLFKTYYNQVSYGIRVGQWDMRYDDFKSLEVFLPPREEQDQIVRYLDWQVSKTNKLISALKKQIALLKQQKQAVINEAVTKGLDPNVPMKDSGVEWCGEIPEAWNVSRLKFACRVNAKTKCDLSDEDIVVFLPMENISVDGKINNETKRKYKEVKSGFTCFQKNDVVVAKITPCFENGKGAWLSSLETDIGFGTTELIVLRAYENLLPEYLYLITQLDFFRREGAEMMTGSAGQKRIPSEFISNFRIGIPQINEQRAIIAYLDEQCSKIDSLIENVKSEITVLVEYRTRLISDVVTGQIDVRDIEVPEFEYIADEADDASDDENTDDEETVEEGE